MNWTDLNEESQIDAIVEESKQQPVVIYKHSTTCSISAMAKNRLERSEAPEGSKFYYLDLLSYRNVSNMVADVFNEKHESPQILIIKDGMCTYEESHNGINMEEIAEQLKA